jgi:DtxR family Mn-dependent transcriptional regulator
METWKRFHEKEVSHSMAHYLQAVASLKKEKGYARVGDIADRLGVSKSGVTSMLRSLSSRGFVDHERYGCVELTDSGLELAERTESNRALLTVFFRDILGIEQEIAQEDACMIEHLVSPQAMVELLRLTALLSSADPKAREVREVLRSYRACECEVEECEICADHCLKESFERRVAQGGKRR